MKQTFEQSQQIWTKLLKDKTKSKKVLVNTLKTFPLKHLNTLDKNGVYFLNTFINNKPDAFFTLIKSIPEFDFNLKDRHGNTPLINAARVDQKIVNYLIEQKVDIHQKNIHGENFLFNLSLLKNCNFEPYLKLGLNINEKCTGGTSIGGTILMHLCQSVSVHQSDEYNAHFYENFKHLLNHGAKIDLLNKNKEDIFDLLIKKSSFKFLQTLINHNPEEVLMVKSNLLDLINNKMDDFLGARYKTELNKACEMLNIYLETKALKNEETIQNKTKIIKPLKL